MGVQNCKLSVCESSAPIPLLRRLNFLFPILRAKFRNRAMLFDEPLIELFHTDILLDSLKCFVMKKNGNVSTSTQILESDYVLGHTI